jgi:hypothetical protein
LSVATVTAISVLLLVHLIPFPVHKYASVSGRPPGSAGVAVTVRHLQQSFDDDVELVSYKAWFSVFGVTGNALQFKARRILNCAEIYLWRERFSICKSASARICTVSVFQAPLRRSSAKAPGFAGGYLLIDLQSWRKAGCSEVMNSMTFYSARYARSRSTPFTATLHAVVPTLKGGRGARLGLKEHRKAVCW